MLHLVYCDDEYAVSDRKSLQARASAYRNFVGTILRRK